MGQTKGAKSAKKTGQTKKAAKAKTAKKAPAKKATAAKAAKPAFKLKDAQRPILERLAGTEEGLRALGWTLSPKFPTRTLMAFEKAGLAKHKQVKAEGRVETVWLPTAAAKKVVQQSAA